MAVILLKLLFSLLTELSNILTRLVLTTAAHVVVQMIQILEVPGESSQRMLDHAKNLIPKFLDYLLNLIINAIASVFSSLFDYVKEGVFTSSSGLAAAVAGLLEKSKTSLDDAVKNIPDVLDAFREMVGKIVADFFNNCSEAVAYVAENVFK